MGTPAYMNPKAINRITIHCAATRRGVDIKASGIAKIGVDRFGQPSYHYVIELNGNTVQLLRHDQRGAHTAGANTGNIGICYVGGVENNKAMTPVDTRTVEQKKALKALLIKLRAEFPNTIIMGHRDHPGVKKACPSFDVSKWLDNVGISMVPPT